MFYCALKVHECTVLEQELDQARPRLAGDSVQHDETTGDYCFAVHVAKPVSIPAFRLQALHADWRGLSDRASDN